MSRNPYGSCIQPRLGSRVVTAALAGAFTVTIASIAGQVVLRLQARAARAVIGKPLGEEVLHADRTYKKKYGDPVQLLLLGDSIAAGLGAERPKHTLGGQLARRLAKQTRRAVHLRTEAVVGSESSMLRAQLAALPPEYAPDVAVIVVGGNDVTHRIRTSVSIDHLTEAITALRERGCGVVVGTCPDLGTVAVLPQPLRSLARAASRQLASAQRQAATSSGARVVSLAEVVGPFFVTQPDRMFATDRFHPSGDGYRRTAKALLPSVLATLGHTSDVPFGHHGPVVADSHR
jgi:lysophospholipase L1-like esterase